MNKFQYEPDMFTWKQSDSTPTSTDTFQFEPDMFGFSSPQPDEPKSAKDDITYQTLYKAEKKSQEEIDKMTLGELNDYAQNLIRESEYLSTRGDIKSFLSEMSFGLSERIPAFKPQEHEITTGGGSITGSILPGLGIFKTLSIPLKYLPQSAKWGSRLAKSAIAAASGGSYEALHEAGKGEELSPLNIAFATSLGLGFDTLFRGIPKAYKFFNELNPSQKSDLLLNSVVPKDLKPTSYKYLQNEVIPEIFNIHKQEYQTLATEAENAAKLKYQQELNTTKAKHDNDLSNLNKINTENQQKFEAAQNQYNQEIQNIKAQHENNVASIEKRNETKLLKYQQSKQRYESELQNVKAEHENQLDKLQKENKLNSSNYEKELSKYEKKVDEIIEKYLKESKEADAFNKQQQEIYAAAQKEYQQQLNNIKAKHNNDLANIESQNQKAQAEFESAKEQYQNKLNQLAAEHKNELDTLNQQNAKAEQEFQQAQQLWEKQKAKDELVNSRIQQANIRENVDPLTGRVSTTGQDIGLRPSPLPTQPTPKDNILNNISKNSITDTRNAGISMTEAIRASDELDYGIVNELYTISDNLNKGLSQEHPKLYQNLKSQLLELSSIPSPSSPEKQKIKAISDILQKLATHDEAGNVIDFLPIENQTLLNQAKSIRYMMDFDFAHGNTSGIFSPVKNALEDAAENTSLQLGKTEAYEASKVARSTYRDWAKTYNNDYIRPFRDTSNVDYSKNFLSSTNIDTFHPVNDILNKTLTGRQLADATKREIIENKLGKYLDNPKLAVGKQFERDLAEVSSILSPDELANVKNELAQGRRSRDIRGKTIEKAKEPTKPEPKTITQVDIPTFKQKPPEPKIIEKVDIPKRKITEPKLKTVEEPKIPPFEKQRPEPKVIEKVDIPQFREPFPEFEAVEQVKIPKFGKKPPEPKIIEKVDIPLRKPAKETPEMRAAAKAMKTTPEDIQAMMNTPTGIQNLERMLSKSDAGKKHFRRLMEYRLKSMLQNRKVVTDFKGDELADIITKENNYDILAEILGDKQTDNLLEKALEIGSDKMKRDKLKKLVSPETLKALVLFHLL